MSVRTWIQITSPVVSCHIKSQGTMRYSTLRAIVPYLNLLDRNAFQRGSDQLIFVYLIILWGTSKSTNFIANHKEFRNIQVSEKLPVNIWKKDQDVINHKAGTSELVAIVDHQDANEHCCSDQPKSQGFVVQSCSSSANCKECNVSDNGFRIVAHITDLWLE